MCALNLPMLKHWSKFSPSFPKEQLLKSSPKPFWKESSRANPLLSALSALKQPPRVGLWKQQFASCFPKQGSQSLVFRAFADLEVLQKKKEQPLALLKEKQPPGPHYWKAAVAVSRDNSCYPPRSVSGRTKEQTAPKASALNITKMKGMENKIRERKNIEGFFCYQRTKESSVLEAWQQQQTALQASLQNCCWLCKLVMATGKNPQQPWCFARWQLQGQLFTDTHNPRSLCRSASPTC